MSIRFFAATVSIIIPLQWALKHKSSNQMVWTSFIVVGLFSLLAVLATSVEWKQRKFPRRESRRRELDHFRLKLMTIIAVIVTGSAVLSVVKI